MGTRLFFDAYPHIQDFLFVSSLSCCRFCSFLLPKDIRLERSINFVLFTSFIMHIPTVSVLPLSLILSAAIPALAQTSTSCDPPRNPVPRILLSPRQHTRTTSPRVPTTTTGKLPLVTFLTPARARNSQSIKLVTHQRSNHNGTSSSAA